MVDKYMLKNNLPLSNIISKFEESLGLDYEKCSKLFGVSRETIQGWESGYIVPSTAIIDGIKKTIVQEIDRKRQSIYCLVGLDLNDSN